MSNDSATCCDQVYFCPTSGETECATHGGFDVCCDRPDRHVKDAPLDVVLAIAKRQAVKWQATLDWLAER